MKRIIINGENIHDIPSFYKEINQVFMAGEDWQIADSLDALNDLLYGGFGILHNSEPVQLVWKEIGQAKETLGIETTKRYYLSKLVPGSTFNRPHFEKKLEALENGNGQTYFDIIMEIIAAHPNIQLIQA
ncbi:ribonuclease inhibitor [Chitinophaga caeni]|uniref:Ribonuclease inhibitor n=1 Tax=Chitinophaga caeni TaxID=2029983 RepID=A0A291QZB4_9BACT|nr:ribonuclease inhibitor [Chitinophaga caeni]ATL49287.1 ribonuclease inhibitor [Chitinophaga caeni]